MARAAATGDPAQGQAIFQGQVSIEGFVACTTCHVTDPAVMPIAGPNLAGIATRGAERVPGLAAPEYIRRSIRVHDEHVVPGYAPGLARAILGRDFGEVLSDDQVEQLVAFLMTLDQPPTSAEAAGGVALNIELSPLPKPSPAPGVTATVNLSPTLTATISLSPSPASSAPATAAVSATPAASATLAPSATPATTLAPTASPAPVVSATSAPSATGVTAPATPAPPSAPPTSTIPPPSATPAPAPPPTPSPAPPPPAGATPTAAPTAEALPSAPDDPELARYAPCVACHDQHPLQVTMPHPLNPTCNECHRGAPSRIGCPSCHSMHGVEYHESDPALPCTTCHASDMSTPKP